MRKIMHLFMLTASLFTVSCSDDDNATTPSETIDPKEYKVQFWGSSSSEVQYPLTVTYYKDNQQGSLVTEQATSQTNTDVIESRTLTSYDKLGFKLTVGNGGQVPVHIVIITDVESNEVIFENYNVNIDTGQTFMYDISDDNYTVQ
jgi:hypothetical protein